MKVGSERFSLYLWSFLLIVTLLLLPNYSQAQSKNQKKLAEAAKEAQRAADVFTEIMNVPDKSIPQS